MAKAQGPTENPPQTPPQKGPVRSKGQGVRQTDLIERRRDTNLTRFDKPLYSTHFLGGLAKEDH